MKEKEIELLPCPFCDGEAEMFEPIQSNAVNVTSFVRCSSDSCEIKTDLYNTTKEAINKWNTRTTTAREARLVEALEIAYTGFVSLSGCVESQCRQCGAIAIANRESIVETLAEYRGEK